ncbi:hypothetical protein ACP70R_030773 [Stipagrostis hirtigluma subsp. patula]
MAGTQGSLAMAGAQGGLTMATARAKSSTAGGVAGRYHNEDREPSVEEPFAGQPLPEWWQQITARSVIVSVVLGALYSFMSMRLGLTTGLVPSFNMSASLMSYFVVSSLTGLLTRCGVATQPFTRQENVVVQTCVIACTTLSLYGGFTSFLPAMTSPVAKTAGAEGKGEDVYALRPGKVMAFLFLVSFSSVFITLPLRKIMIVDYKLMYPSGSAIAGIVNSFHTPKGAKIAKLQVRALLKFLVGSFFWSFFQWFYSAGDDCGFQSFPLFGLQAYKERLYFDFSASLVGIGMICPPLVNFSLLLGAISSAGIIGPLLKRKQGTWYTDPSPTNFRGVNGYKVPMGLSMVLADSLFQLGALSVKAVRHFHSDRQENKGVKSTPGDKLCTDHPPSPSYDDQRRLQVFQSDNVPTTVAFGGYTLFAIISVIFVPRIFPQLKLYHVAICYALAPLLAFCNSYASGLTDWSLGTVYGKLAIFIFGAWVGKTSGGQIAGLVACGVVVVVIGNAGELMQDYKTAYLTLTSPLSMFTSQVIGTAIGCIINPFILLGFQKMVGEENLGKAGSAYGAPMAVAYRGLAVLSSEGIKALPQHSMELSAAAFVLALVVDSLSAIASARKWRIKAYIPNIMAMTVPFFVGPTFAIDMAIGCLILFIWKQTDKQAATMLAVVVASGLICGEGLWALPSAFLQIFKVDPPICMKFLSSYQNEEMQRRFMTAH